MLGTRSITAVLTASLLSAAVVVGQTAGQVAPAQAAPFIGNWTLALEGPNGPGAFELSVKVEKEAEKETILGEISSDQLPKQPIREISMADKSLALAYSFTWEGNPVDAVVSLTPATDGKMAAQIDFAGGAYIMSGAATKKEK